MTRIGIWLGLACFCGAGHAATPELFRSQRFDAAMIARAANHYVSIGEQASLTELNALASTDTRAPRRSAPLGDDRLAQRVAWMCLILWPARPGQLQRPPTYGVLAGIEGHLSPKDWPLYPLVHSGGSYFVLGTDYMLAGLAEPPRLYLADCASKGVFRRVPVPVPTRAQAQADADALRRSASWQASWFAFPELESKVWRFIEAQADSIE